MEKVFKTLVKDSHCRFHRKRRKRELSDLARFLARFFASFTMG